ncbi:helix-turn-helix domain-containing protein [Sphingomonas sp. RHCKR7]|uniref:helix-turn-helix domain-containing protein n=1 Tax=Sphingomonas folli TaxID=2862497 RepID=UPI001C67FA67|nr:helix-turn-helix transcriptional regulator [Sphingomonas folli]MBW6528542.1 helix-turn-helix domain-containing protein [Sphingomonas folli]
MSPAAEPVFPAYANALGFRIEQERLGREMSKEELAQRAGLASRYLWRVEEGKQNLTFKSLVAIALGLDVPLAVLLQDVEDLAAHPPDRAVKKPRGKAGARARTKSSDGTAR